MVTWPSFGSISKWACARIVCAYTDGPCTNYLCSQYSDSISAHMPMGYNLSGTLKSALIRGELPEGACSTGAGTVQCACPAGVLQCSCSVNLHPPEGRGTAQWCSPCLVCTGFAFHPSTRTKRGRGLCRLPTAMIFTFLGSSWVILVFEMTPKHRVQVLPGDPNPRLSLIHI